jgi:hypothetical protein
VESTCDPFLNIIPVMTNQGFLQVELGAILAAQIVVDDLACGTRVMLLSDTLCNKDATPDTSEP